MLILRIFGKVSHPDSPWGGAQHHKWALQLRNDAQEQYSARKFIRMKSLSTTDSVVITTYGGVEDSAMLAADVLIPIVQWCGLAPVGRASVW